MKHPVVVGLQYGDEGKGKITDVLAKQADWVIRFNGGNNAGHTLWLNGKKLVTHSVPSGVRSSHTKNFIGAGCVIDPIALQKELDELNAAGAALTPERLKIDFRAHVTFPLHLALDAAREGGDNKIGTTKRGIGPTYTTKMDRFGLRVGDVLAPGAEDKLRHMCTHYNPLLRALGLDESPLSETLKVLQLAADLFRRFASHDELPFSEVSKTAKCVLEGAQGVLLDLDHGSYPYVTSSNTLPAFAAVGTPFPMSRLGQVLGIAKAYLTRVGDGPFETELNDETGERIRTKGQEFGATTGRPRRVGWLNLDELKRAVQLSDCTAIALTKSDVLDGEVKVSAFMNGAYAHFDGWDYTTKEGALNPKLEAFIAAVENYVGVPVAAVGTGQDREAIFWRHPIADFWTR